MVHLFKKVFLGAFGLAFIYLISFIHRVKYIPKVLKF